MKNGYFSKHQNDKLFVTWLTRKQENIIKYPFLKLKK